jgi:hypothetical protein
VSVCSRQRNKVCIRIGATPDWGCGGDERKKSGRKSGGGPEFECRYSTQLRTAIRKELHSSCLLRFLINATRCSAFSAQLFAFIHLRARIYPSGISTSGFLQSSDVTGLSCEKKKD